MSSVTTTPCRMETFARALDRAVMSAIVPRARIDQLRSAFIATDSQGRSWTLDPEFHRWGRLDGDVWMIDEPPSQLFMDSELRASLEKLEAMAARAVVKGPVLHAPRAHWFRTPVAPEEQPEMPASISSWKSATTPQPPLDREQAPLQVFLEDPARSSELMTTWASAPPETLPARPAIEDPGVEPVPMASVVSSEVSVTEEPATRAFEEIAPALAPVPMVSVVSSEVPVTEELATRMSEEVLPAPEPVPTASSVSPEASPGVRRRQVSRTAGRSTRTHEEIPPAPEPAYVLLSRAFTTAEPASRISVETAPVPSVATHPAVQAARPAIESAPRRFAIPEAHLRFAGPGIAPALNDSSTPVRAAMASADAMTDRTPAARLSASVPSHDHEHWVPTSIAPHPMFVTERPEARDDRAHIYLCGTVAALFLALSSWTGNGRGYAAALLFGLLTVTLLVLNLMGSGHDRPNHSRTRRSP